MRKQIEILTRQMAMMPKSAPFDGRVSESDYATASYLLQRLTGVDALSLKLEEPASAVHLEFDGVDALQATCQLIVDTYHSQHAEEVAA